MNTQEIPAQIEEYLAARRAVSFDLAGEAYQLALWLRPRESGHDSHLCGSRPDMKAAALKVVTSPTLKQACRSCNRKKWLHVDSANAGPKGAAILSILESCKRLGVPVKEYLLSVLPGMAARSTAALLTLTPTRWASSPH